MVDKKKTKKKTTHISREAALARHYRRPQKARLRDECETHKIIKHSPTKDWSLHPNMSDVLGIDVPTDIDENGKMKLSKKQPLFCIGGPEMKKTIKGKKINPIYDPKYNTDGD